MELLTLFQKAYRVRRFIIVQFIALVGWIIVQSSFSLTPAGQSIPFPIMILSEGVWWIALLAIMLTLFTREYNSFAHSALELEEANRQLREATNRLIVQIREKEPIPQPQGESVASLVEEGVAQQEEIPAPHAEEVAEPKQEEPALQPHEEPTSQQEEERAPQPYEEPVAQSQGETELKPEEGSTSQQEEVPEPQTASSTDG